MHFAKIDVFADIVKVCQMDHILMWYTPNDFSQRNLQYGTILIGLQQLSNIFDALRDLTHLDE